MTKRSYNLPKLYVYQLDEWEFVDFKHYVEDYPKLVEYFFKDGWDYCDVIGWYDKEVNTWSGSDKRFWMRNGFEVWDWDDECFDFIEACEYLGKAYEDDEDAMIAFLEYAGDDQADHFEDAYQGDWDSEKDYAEQLFDELYIHDVPDFLIHYINYEAFSRDMFMSDYTYQDGYVFSINW